MEGEGGNERRGYKLAGIELDAIGLRCGRAEALYIVPDAEATAESENEYMCVRVWV